MKIILSRKGFDSSAGGVPSPIFPDGTMWSLPIPDRSSTITYGEITYPNGSVGDLVEQLAGLPRRYRAHLDPDLSPDSILRCPGWRPLFGQADLAERHLINQNVGPGDVFIFFGLFRRVEQTAVGWRFIRACRPIHAIFGWLQIERRIPISQWPGADRWALYHPHFVGNLRPPNVLYVATERMCLPSDRLKEIAGAGLLGRFSPKLSLTHPGSDRPSRWLLPRWFDPVDRPSTLTYHSDPSRWHAAETGVELSSVGRGQEFVLDCSHYPEALDWVEDLLH